MAQRLRALTALPEVLSSIPSNHMVVIGSDTLFWYAVEKAFSVHNSQTNLLSKKKDKEIGLQIWDTAGQERFRTITQSYYRSANGAILAYDITKRSTFLSVPHWIEDVRKYAGSNIVQLLIGNKSDLADFREVPLTEAQSLAEHYDILCAIETSAKDSSNVEEAFTRVATELIMRHGGPLFSEKSTDHIQLDSKDVTESWGCGC
ncbi:ras-related protein Rab-43-like protein [Cricetulus griseus]|nr:ras-related protein Rab-43-like protein [Cricetulus griseus]